MGQGSCLEIYTDVNECNTRLESQACPELCNEVSAFSGIGEELTTNLADQPAVLFRHLATPSRETERFLEIALRLDRNPLLMTYTDDRFTPAQNPYKKRLAKVRVQGLEGKYTNVSVISFSDSVNTRLKDIRCVDGTSLVQFHGRLARQLLPPFPVLDMNGFMGDEPRAYYERIFAMFTCMGILVESYVRESYESPFIDDVVLPAFQATIARFGCRPIITRLLPIGSELDPYWESLPPTALESALTASGQAQKIARLCR